MPSVRCLAVTVLLALLGPASAAANDPVGRSAAAKIVLDGKLKRMKGLTATYTSSRGTFTATWIGKRHYRIAGRISGRALRGTFRTQQTASRKRYRASGSGRLGRRTVRISGGGPNDLSRATLVLR